MRRKNESRTFGRTFRRVPKEKVHQRWTLSKHRTSLPSHFGLKTRKQIPQVRKRYCNYLKGRGRAPKTVWEHRHSLRKFALPFFLERTPKLENPNLWPSRSLKFSDYVLGTRKQSAFTCRKAVAALRAFYRFLTEEGIVYTDTPLRLRSPQRPKNPTPLKRIVSPDEILAFAKAAEPECALLAVIGYFFSLRTFELFALRPADFVAGSAAASIECCRVKRWSDLYDRLAVRIHRQRGSDGIFREPKRASFGMVACFLQEAAEWLVPKLNERKRLELLFPRHPDSSIAFWRRYGIPGVTLKDLRRASIYFLGHYSKVELIALKGHARHRFATTTELYLRRPVERDVTTTAALDLAG